MSVIYTIGMLNNDGVLVHTCDVEAQNLPIIINILNEMFYIQLLEKNWEIVIKYSHDTENV